MSGFSAGLFLPQIRMDFATIEARARVAEEAGFASVWFMDHMAAPAASGVDTYEGWTTATAIAARTERLRIGHMVLCDPFRHPVLLAKMAATLDVISGGRLELGLGWGSVPAELATYGFGAPSARDRAARMAETLDVLERMFAGEPFSYEGRFVSIDGAVGRPVPVQARIPVHIGGAGARLTLPLVRRYADWWNCPSYAISQLAELRPLVGEVRVSAQHPIGLAASTAAREEVVATAQRRFGSWGGLVSGTPDEVAAALRAEAALGVELFIVQFSDLGRPETIGLFAEEVLPALAV